MALMDLAQLLERRSLFVQQSANSKRQLLQSLSELAARQFGLDADQVLIALSERERQASTGVGSGVAVPHAILPGLTSMRALFIRMETPVEFESVDEVPVDLVFALFSPPQSESEHLRALAKISRLLRQKELRTQLRAVSNIDALYALLTSETSINAA